MYVDKENTNDALICRKKCMNKISMNAIEKSEL